MVQNYQKCSKWSKIAGSTYRPERRRARRTKSKGPKGLQLEVGAQTSSKFIFFDNDNFTIIHNNNFDNC